MSDSKQSGASPAGNGRTRLFPIVPLILLIVILLIRWDLFRDGLWSLTAGLLLLVTQPSRAGAAFNLRLLDFWIASLSLSAMIVWLSWRLLPMNKSGEHQTATPMREALRRLHRNRLVKGASFVITIFVAAALWSPLLAPVDPNHQQDILLTRLKKPMESLKYVNLRQPADTSGASSLLLDRWITLNRRLLNRDEHILYLTDIRLSDSTVTLVQGNTREIIPTELLEDLLPDSRTFLFGTDKYGRDIFSRILYGARISLSIGISAMIVAVVLGSLVGVLAGYYGGWTDRVLMRTVDLVLAFPGLFLILLIVAIFGNSLLWLILILGLTGWMGVARLVRGQILSLKEQEFVLAAQALGYSGARIVFKHLLPNALSPVIVAASLRIGTIILIEAGLSFLGLGVQPPTASWGNMINEGRDSLLVAWWISTMPGLAMVLVVTSFNVIGDGLRDVLDPRIKAGV